MSNIAAQQPIIFLGGFLIGEASYHPLRDWIQTHHNHLVIIIPVSKLDWMLTSWSYGWRRILDRVDAAVDEISKKSLTGKVTLIGHSSGGMILRLYLGDQPFAGRTYRGFERCNRLVTLGTPNQANRATPLRAMVDRLYPGSCFADHVDYVSIAGSLSLNERSASSLAKRIARSSYQQISGDPEDNGDGLVPVSSALLQGSRQLTLDDTAHGGAFGTDWYCSPSRINQWISFSNSLE